MATTNFVRWASGADAQLMPIETYKQKALSGLVPGIADLEQANRAWKQATAIGAAFAHLVITNKGLYEGVNFDDSESDQQLAEKIFAVFAKRIPSEMADGSISTAKLQDGSVTTVKLANSLDFNSKEVKIKGLPLAQLKTKVLKEREIAVATDTLELYVGDGKTAGGVVVTKSVNDDITQITKILASMTNAIAILGKENQPFKTVEV